MNKKAYIEHFSRVYGAETAEVTPTRMDKNTAARVLVKTAADRYFMDKFKEFYDKNKATFRGAAIGGAGGLLTGLLFGKNRARSGLLGALIGSAVAGGGRYAYDEFFKENTFGETRHSFNKRVKDYAEEMKRYQTRRGDKPKPFKFHPGISPDEAAKLQGPVRPELLQAEPWQQQLPVIGLKEGRRHSAVSPKPNTPLPSK